MMLGSLAGGIGLFLLGMWLMTDGLKFAAGGSLRRLLARWTGTPLRGIASGALITSLVQSSSAVTVATIGIVNAGLMGLSEAVTVIYGSNIGTTMTGWLVALIGFKINIKLLALPLIGVGMILRLLAAERRLGAFGMALAGFGVFFLGVDILKTAFAAAGASPALGALAGGGVGGVLLSLGVGVVMTVLMQSSSAAMAVIITAAAGGVISLEAALAMVIGTNIGTTSTALLATLGATPNARRVAAAHLSFNVVSALVALLVLPLFILLIRNLEHADSLDLGVPVLLALFHTLFNVLGVAVMWPLTTRLVGELRRRFRSAEEDEARPRYLDRNVVATPVLAMQALSMELIRIGGIALRMAKAAMSAEGAAGARLDADAKVIDRLVDAVGDFSAVMQRSHLPPELDDVLPNALRVTRYYTEMAELTRLVDEAQRELPAIEAVGLAADISHFKGSIVDLLDRADAGAPEYSAEVCAAQLESLKQEYQRLKSHLLRAGTADELPVRRVVEHLDVFSNMRRLAEQAEKGARYLAALRELGTSTGTDEAARDADEAAA
ncbi:MAG: Na/Pi symporter [Gammaproteobacteria bacterium]